MVSFAMAVPQEYRIDGAHALPARDACARLGVDPDHGLESAEAERRLAAVGRNELVGPPTVPAWRRLLAHFETPLVPLLIAAGGISLVAWTIERTGALPYEALTIGAIVALNALLGYVQESRAQEAVASLKAMTAATAVVIRGGARRSLPAAEFVPGDIVAVDEGATVPGDARVLESVSLQVVEAALTGESVPVAKGVAPVALANVVADRSGMVFAGTTVTFGRGRVVVTATGMDAEVGRIAGMPREEAAEPTPLQRELDALGRILGWVVIAIAAIVGLAIIVLQRDFSSAALVVAAGRGESLVLPLLPTMILWINLVTDGLPALALGVDPADRGLMLHRPRAVDRGVISRRMWWWVAISAVVMGTGTLLVFDAGLSGGLIEGRGDVRTARTQAFNTLVLFQVFAVLCVRSDTAPLTRQWFANRWLWGSIAAAIGLQVAAIHVPALQNAFGTRPLAAGDWCLCTLVAATIIVASEGFKACCRSADRRRAGCLGRPFGRS